jgi:hypothetical protein
MHRYFPGQSHFEYKIIETSSGAGSSFWSAFGGAFAGAFFAFIFGLITNRLTKKWERFIQHKNAFVKLDHLLNEHLDGIVLAEHQAKTLMECFKKRIFTYSRFSLFSLPENLNLEFGSLMMSNKYFEYKTTIKRFNHDMTSINYVCTRFEDIVISGKTLKDENLKDIISDVGKFTSDFEKLTNQTKELLALARLNTAELQTKNSFFYGVLNSNWEILLTKEDVQKEIKHIDKEIESIQKLNRYKE